MHADALPPPRTSGDNWVLPVLLAVVVHVLLVLVFLLAWLWSPERTTEAAAGAPTLEASMQVSAADAAAARRALTQSERLDTRPEPVAEPEPEPVPVPEDTIPPPQPVPEPRPQDALSPQQSNAQERVVEPDVVDQQQVSANAISQETAKQEQEAKRRQEQIDLTERKRQEEAEQRQRLARQQEAEQKKIADQARQANEAKAAEEERQKKIAELRSRRAQAEREAKLAEQKLQQVTDARNRNQASNTGSTTSAPAAGTPGQGGTSEDMSAKYAAAIQQAVLAQWVRPDSVPLGRKCRISIRQIPGGNVVSAQVSPDCPFDEAGRRSVEAAVLRAQPLPYRGFEDVFARNLNFTFTAQDR